MKTFTLLFVSIAASTGHIGFRSLLTDAASETKNDGRNVKYRGAPLFTLQNTLAKLRRVNASTLETDELGGKRAIALASEKDFKRNKHILTSDAFITAFEHVMDREFPEDSGGLSSLFKAVILKPAAQNENVSAQNMKRQMVSFLDLIENVGELPPEDERLRDVLEVFAYMPVARPHLPAVGVEDRTSPTREND